MLLRLIKKEVSKWCHARTVMSRYDRMPLNVTKKKTPTLTESVKVGASNPALSGWSSKGLRHKCEDTYPVNPVWVVSAVRIGLHVIGRGYICSTSPGEALTQLQVSRLNYDILPPPCAQHIGEGMSVQDILSCYISIVVKGIDWYPQSKTRPGGWMSNYCASARHCNIYIFWEDKRSPPNHKVFVLKRKKLSNTYFQKIASQQTNL